MLREGMYKIVYFDGYYLGLECGIGIDSL